MMIGVAQVIGMKPTLRSFFSIAPPCANTSVAVLSGKNCDSAASAADSANDFRKGRRAGQRYRMRLNALAQIACAGAFWHDLCGTSARTSVLAPVPREVLMRPR